MSSSEVLLGLEVAEPEPAPEPAPAPRPADVRAAEAALLRPQRSLMLRETPPEARPD